MKKIIYLVILFVLINIVFAVENKPFIFVRDNNLESINISIIDQNRFYEADFFRGFLPPESNFSIVFKDKNQNVLLKDNYYLKINNFYEFIDTTFTIQIFENEDLLITKEIGFCNDNGKCEPCKGSLCSLVENRLICSDCNSGQKDYYCDLVNDGICDPDCNNADADCKNCVNCWYKGMKREYTSCSRDFQGEICKPGQPCSGEFVYADDSGSLCCRGTCIQDAVVDGPEIPKEPDEKIKENKTEKSQEKQPEAENKDFPFIAAGILVFFIICLAGYAVYKNKKKN
ncbi:hypothetical protein GF327_04170 [Candidatus Woesearchaeota archaeon]|nr:hypothetical protein [Candidatus Woesearchaeota archaeon]